MATAPERPRRRYSSPVRRAQAEQTRRLILAGARRAFTEAGYAGTTMEAVAAAAGVSVAAVYAAFASKRGLLVALLRDAGGAPDIRALVARVEAESVPERRLAGVAAVVRTIIERERALLELLLAAGRGQEELRAAWEQVHAQQRAALGRALAPLAGRMGPDALDTLCVLASPESYQVLVAEQGWTGGRWERWLTENALRLLGPAGQAPTEPA